MVTFSTVGFEATLARVKNAPRQIKFATVKAINAVTKEAQGSVVSSLLPSKFTLRAKGRAWQLPGGPLGFNVRPFASMAQDEPFAVIGSRADWLKLQEEGGTKRTGSGKALSVPVRGGARPTEGAVVPGRNKVRRLLARKGFFVTRARTGRNVVLQRLRGKEGGVKLWFGFQAQATIKPRLGFVPFATARANAALAPAFRKALAAALSTAR